MSRGNNPGRANCVALDGSSVSIGALLAVAAVLLRVPFLHAPASADESGFLIVAQAWRAAGHSLYGNYWVDRPPLLLELFKLASAAGGLVPLRLLGAAAAATTVLFITFIAHRLGGRRGAAWAGLAALALLSSPILGTVATNGELLAAPLVAVGVWAMTEAVVTDDQAKMVVLTAIAGAAAAGAVLVKQNMVDVAIFAVVLVVIAVRDGRIHRAMLVPILSSFLVGGGFLTASVLLIARRLGTRPDDVFFAAYPFRIRAAHIMSTQNGTERVTHLLSLAETALLSLGPLILAALIFLIATRRLSRHDPALHAVTWAVLATSGYAAASIVAGGSYWHHYLVELAVPTSIAAGVICSVGRGRTGRGLVAATAAVALVAWGSGLFAHTRADGQVIGDAIAGSAAPGDSVVSVLGDADIAYSAGLTSPYTYLWSLPARVLDPHLSTLAATLSGPHAPTWVVIRGMRTRQWMNTNDAGPVRAHHYHRVTILCGRSIYLRGDLKRPHPAVTEQERADHCRLPLVR